MNLVYCPSRFRTVRQHTREINVGELPMGGSQPIRVQSMVNTPTLDIEATARQTIELAEAGCELVRITAPNKEAARALKDIHAKVRAAGCQVPLVADIHFLPVAAMEAIEHVEKVRVNPGNYADKKRFKQRDYTDAEYKEEIQRLFEAFSPLVKRAKELGRALRIGTNHGSLSDRIMNRYGDTPMGMVESTLEFVRICEAHGFHNLCVSMKSSNPKVMIGAYRLCVMKMAEEGMHYPMHLGVTEAGGGEDARIKSAAGIGALLYDGIGDTVRVSLTEDPIYEVPVCRDLIRRVETLWGRSALAKPAHEEALDSRNPFEYQRRETVEIGHVGSRQLPRVWIRPRGATAQKLLAIQKKRKDAPIEGLVLPLSADSAVLWASLQGAIRTAVWQIVDDIEPDDMILPPAEETVVLRSFATEAELLPWLARATAQGWTLAAEVSPEAVRGGLGKILQSAEGKVIVATGVASQGRHPVGQARALAQALADTGCTAPLWLRVTPDDILCEEDDAEGLLLEASMQLGALLCDGLGDIVSVETTDCPSRATGLGYDILQGMRLRTTKTEYISCPSCGRTLYDLQKTTAAIQAKTGHLKGVTIAIMGCIVNGPGEMADADFGYVGGAPGKINLYVRKECTEVGIPMEQAVDRLIGLIKAHGKWVDPEPQAL